MKALTLTQPWASLVACGAKRIETRSWFTSYRGPVAIHAAKGFPPWARELVSEYPFRDALGGAEATALPRGCVLATATLLRVERMDWQNLAHVPNLEREFGDWEMGRFAWYLGDIVALPVPVPAKGALGLWEWTEPGE